MSAIGGAVRSRLVTGVGGALLATAMFAATSALASDDSNVIHACASARGHVRVVGSADDCTPGESALQWNERGPQGPQGPAGAPGVSGLERVNVSGSFAAEQFGSVSATCPSGKKVVGGGFFIGGAYGAFTVAGSSPNSSLDAWVVSGKANSAATVVANAVCATAT